MSSLIHQATVVILVAFVFSCSGPADSQPLQGVDCFGELKKPLVEGGYSGGMDCSILDVKIKKVGDVILKPNTISVYDLRYRIKSGSSSHGGQRLLFLIDRKKYVGQYSIDTPPVRKFALKDASVFVNVSRNKGNEIKITVDGPPKSVFLNQNVLSLYQ